MATIRPLLALVIGLCLSSITWADSTELLLEELETLREQVEARRETLRAELQQLDSFLGTGEADEDTPMALPEMPPVPAISAAAEAEAPFDIGADLFSRYVWRGTDFGNSASIQPWIAYAQGYFEVGAWSSYALTAAGAGANENDLYIAFSSGPFGLAITDYYFPEGNNFFDYDKDTGAHIVEISASLAIEEVSLLGAFNFWGDGDDSFYAEIAYAHALNSSVGISLAAGFGNGAYTTDNDPNLVNLSFGVEKGGYTAAYILNPEAETNFLVFGRSF